MFSSTTPDVLKPLQLSLFNTPGLPCHSQKRRMCDKRLQMVLELIPSPCQTWTAFCTWRSFIATPDCLTVRENPRSSKALTKAVIVLRREACVPKEFSLCERANLSRSYCMLSTAMPFHALIQVRLEHFRI